MRGTIVTLLCLATSLVSGQILQNVMANCTDLKILLGVDYSQVNNTDSEPDFSKVTLALHAPDKTVKFFKLSQAIDIVSDPRFNKSLPVSIIIHGFLSDNSNPYNTEMTGNLLKKGGTNVLFLDASSVIFSNYMRASTTVRFLGEELGAQLFKFVQAGIDPSKIHLMGHSLGAHVSGFTGKTFQTLSSGKKIGRISGLDPAGPCFFDGTSDLTLFSTDADFVDVIHTDAGNFGIIKPLGHVDFYPNGGSNQPVDVLALVSHIRAWRLFAESILYPQNFIGVACPDWKSYQKGLCNTNTNKATMGYAASTGTTGIFYLRTKGISLYGLKEEGTKPTDFTVWWNQRFA